MWTEVMPQAILATLHPSCAQEG